MRKFHQWTLTQQIVTSILSVLVISIIVSGEVFRLVQQKTLVSTAKSQTEITLQTLSATILDDLITEDIPHLETIAQQIISSNSNIIFLHIENESGVHLVDVVRSGKSSGNNILNHSHDVDLEGEVFGKIHIAIDLSERYRQINEQVFQARAILAAALLILALVIIVLIKRIIINPVKKINHKIKNISDGKLEEPLSRQISQDFNELAVTINAHADVLKREEVYKDKLKQAKSIAEQASRAKTEFLSGMSHEIRTPMNAILGFSELLVYDPDDPLSEEQQELANEIIKAGNTLLQIISNVLELVEVDGNTDEELMMPFNLVNVINESMLSIQSAADEKQISLRSLINDKETFVINGNQVWAGKIVFQLLSNAVQYNKIGGEVMINEPVVENGFVKIEICDTGIGINEEDLIAIFEPFVRLDQSRTTSGAGIGLTIAKKLMQLMNGDIGVYSRPGEGSCFWIAFKLTHY